MRHQNYKYKFNMTSEHRKALMRNLTCELIDHQKIKTTEIKCKALRPFVEKLITLAKNDSLANRRLAYKKLNNPVAVKTLFEKIGPKFKERNGGYTRILKLADARVGDNAKMGIIALVE